MEGGEPVNQHSKVVADVIDAAEQAMRLHTLLSRLAASVQELCALLDFHDTGKGFRWQNAFKQMAASRGLSVSKATDSKHDCRVNGLRVQCKRIDKDNGLICTTPIIGRSYCGYELSDWDVLALQQQGILLIIPASALVMADGVRLQNQIRPGSCAHWENRWDVFGDSFSFVSESQTKFDFKSAELANGR